MRELQAPTIPILCAATAQQDEHGTSHPDGTRICQFPRHDPPSLRAVPQNGPRNRGLGLDVQVIKPDALVPMQVCPGRQTWPGPSYRRCVKKARSKASDWTAAIPS